MPQTWRVLMVDDEEITCRQVAEHYETWEHGDHRLVVETVDSFDEGLKLLGERQYDLVILDVYQGQAVEGGEESGKQAFEKIRATRFIPVVFYTALPASVQDVAGPLVKVAEKSGEAFASLDEKVTEHLDAPLLRINRALGQHVEHTVREYMWEFASQHWPELAGTGDAASLAYLICRRVAASLDVEGAERLATDLNQPQRAHAQPVADSIHPLRYYLMPPSGAGTEYRTGDILRKPGTPASNTSPGSPLSYWVVLTPWCDLTIQRGNARNAEYVLVGRCLLLTEFPEHQEWISERDPSRTRTKKLRSLIGSPISRPEDRQEGRYYFLPGVLGLPDLLVDFQQTATVPYGEMNSFQKVATLDSPFSESLVSWFVRFISRIGTPNLDLNAVLQLVRQRGSPQAP